jgi:hypothetical protein
MQIQKCILLRVCTVKQKRLGNKTHIMVKNELSKIRNRFCLPYITAYVHIASLKLSEMYINAAMKITVTYLTFLSRQHCKNYIPSFKSIIFISNRSSLRYTCSFPRYLSDNFSRYNR